MGVTAADKAAMFLDAAGSKKGKIAYQMVCSSSKERCCMNEKIDIVVYPVLKIFGTGTRYEFVCVSFLSTHVNVQRTHRCRYS